MRKTCDPITQECSPPKIITIGFFALGVIASISFRLIMVLDYVATDWVRPVWYVGALGFMGFFIYRFAVSKKRNQAIRKYELIQKLKSDTKLSRDERAAAIEILTSLDKSLEKYNFLIIFVLSVVAIALDLILAHAGL